MLPNKRIVLLTDSLGCPREQIPVEQTWTEMMLREFGSIYSIYPICRHGLSVSTIDWNYLEEINPDVIVVQVGIVDACRRAFPILFRKILFRMPNSISKPFRVFGSKHHKWLTDRFDFRTATVEQYKIALEKISSIAGEQVFSIVIAKPGSALCEKISHVEEDVESFRLVQKELQEEGTIALIDPFRSLDPNYYLLDDGHHLNKIGHQMVFESVRALLTKCN